MAPNCSRVCMVCACTALPRVMMAMTEAMPMMTPSRVSIERILLVRRLPRASPTDSPILMRSARPSW